MSSTEILVIKRREYMMEIHAVNIIYDICIMSALMLIAKIISTKIKIIQKLYIPSALVAGFLGLLLGKQF